MKKNFFLIITYLFCASPVFASVTSGYIPVDDTHAYKVVLYDYTVSSTEQPCYDSFDFSSYPAQATSSGTCITTAKVATYNYLYTCSNMSNDPAVGWNGLGKDTRLYVTPATVTSLQSTVAALGNSTCEPLTTPTCEDIAADMIASQCPSGDATYTCAPGSESSPVGFVCTAPGDPDRDCNDIAAECIASCSGTVTAFNCEDTNGTSTVLTPCTCDNDIDLSTENNPDTDSDGVPDEHGLPDDSPDVPDSGDSDSARLDKIIVNTGETVTNTATIARINEDELNKVNKALSESNKLLGSIASNTASSSSSGSSSIDLSGVESRLDTLNNNLDTSLDNSQDVETAISDQYDANETEIETAIQDQIDNPALDGSFFDGLYTDISSYFVSDVCEDITYTIPFAPAGNNTLSLTCDWSDNFKAVFGWLVSIYTIFTLMELVYSGITPKGTGNVKLFGDD